MTPQAPGRIRSASTPAHAYIWPTVLGLSLAISGAFLCATARAEDKPATQPSGCEYCGCSVEGHGNKQPRHDEHKRRLGSADKPDADRRFEERQNQTGLDRQPGEGRPPEAARRRRPGGPQDASELDSPGRPGLMRDRIQQALFRDIDLSAEQREQIDAVMEDSRQQMLAWTQQNRDALRAAREEMQAARESGDPERMQKAGEQMRELMEKAPRPDREEITTQIRDILTAQQAEQFDQNLQLVQERMQQMRTLGPDRSGGERPRRAGKQKMTPDESSTSDTPDSSPSSDDQLDL